MKLALGFELIALVHSRHGPGEAFAGFAQFNRNLHLVHTVGGRGWLRLGGERFEAVPGAVLVVPPFTTATWEKEAGPGWEMINLHYRLTGANGVPMETSHRLPVTLRPGGPGKSGRIASLLRRSLAELEEPTLAHRLRAGRRLFSLVADYWGAFALPSGSPRQPDEAMLRLARKLDRLDPFDAETLAASLSLSVSQMNRRFRRSRGAAPREYWMNQRLAAAKEALREGDETMATIAGGLGFCDEFFFSRWFRRRVGLPPGAFRKQCRSGKRF